jgi:kynureninase
MNLEDAQRLDAADPLRSLREFFQLPEGITYLDGNSLGALPKATPDIKSWNAAGWIDLPRRLGDRLAPWLGARPGEVLVADSTSVNLYKVLHAALQLQQGQRRVIVSERSNFPTDNYIAQSVARAHGGELVLAETPDEIAGLMDERCAVLMLTHVNYRTGRMHDMGLLTRWAHQAGALAVWDLAHSAGAVPIDLLGCAADFAIGCGYKYLNGGPGAPAFVWMHPRHEGQVWQPLTGWLGHAHPFDFDSEYLPAPGIQQYQCGTPPVLSMTALDTALDVFDAAQKLGGMKALRAKSLALTEAFIDSVEARVPGAAIATPREATLRGSQVSFSLPKGVDGYAVMQALIAQGVIGDFRAGTPELLRFGFAPLYNGFADVARAVDVLAGIVAIGSWNAPQFTSRAKVT